MLGKLESEHYYTYNCNQALGSGVQHMAPHIPNGEPSALSPHNRHKRLKRSNMSSISSAEDGEGEGVEGSEEGQPIYYGKSPSSSLNGQSSWQGEHSTMDPGKTPPTDHW